MKKVLFIFIITLVSSLSASSQQSLQLDENTVVKDTIGTIIPYALWSQLITTGRYKIKPEKTSKENNTFIITRLSDEEYEKRLATMAKPRVSKFFKTGADFNHFKAKDINGNSINTKKIAGKILVLNFWFINCPPCQKEIPELHKLAESYKADSSIIFIAVALDQKQELKEFLEGRPFGYQIVDAGRFITDQYRINAYPTNVIVDQNGKVYFHSSGLAINTAYWLRKSLEELKNPSTN